MEDHGTTIPAATAHPIPTPTPQEELWYGEFGNQYTQRNSADTVEKNASFWRWATEAIPPDAAPTVLELGANIGRNIKALRVARPDMTVLEALEINRDAAKQCRTHADHVYETSIFGFQGNRRVTWHMTLTKGLLIHIPPDRLPDAYDTLYYRSKRYILIAEYYSTRPREIHYRAPNSCWARDFAGEMLDRYPKLKLLDYGFSYHRDPRYQHPFDDISVFVMEKEG